MNNVYNFNFIIDKSNKQLNESNINRMLQWLKDCDCAFISAFRTELKDIKNKDLTYFGPNKDWQVGKKFTHEENRQKNKLMVAELLQLGYGVTKMKGVYPEGMTDESSEESYLVVNRNNDENFLDNLLRISEYYNQDSIYYKEKGKTTGNLIGTNGCGWPEYHQKGNDSELKTDTASNYMSRLGNKAFSFVGQDAEKVANRKEAMDSIEQSKGTDDEWRQRYWKDNDGTTFHSRKENRKNKMKEAINFWRNMTEGKMLIKEDIHPLTRKTMGEALREMRKNYKTSDDTNNVFEKVVGKVFDEIDEARNCSGYKLYEIYNGKDGGAYRASRYLANAISSNGKDCIYSSLNEGIQFEPAANEKGGIIVFSTDVNAEKQSENKIINWIKQKMMTICNRLNATKKIDKIAAANNLVGWTIGHYFNGRYTSPKNGKQYGENSLSVEIIGVNFETLMKIAMEICSAFTQESVLVKDYSSGRVLFADRS